MSSLYSLENIVFALEIIGTIAFAISGATLGLEKGMDLMGITILGPPLTFRDPTYLIISVVVSVIVFTPPVRKWIFSDSMLYEWLMLIMDSVGLGVFTVLGIKSAYTVSSIHGVILFTFVGMLTGVGGGVLRDMMAGNRPYIFVKHFYASASLIGALTCIALWDRVGTVLAMGTGAGLIVLLRLLAAHYHWSLPKAKMPRDN